INYPQILHLGGKAIGPLLLIARQDGHVLQQVATQLIQDIVRNAAYLPNYEQLFTQQQICPECLTNFILHEIELPLYLSPITYYGCKGCYNNQNGIGDLERVVANLDQASKKMYLHQNQILYINWLIYRQLFSFDEVHIVQASDEDVERFAVQVANNIPLDDETYYKRIPCFIASSCDLSLNTKRILQNVFGHVGDLQGA
ncbi:MAG: hypothetical protein AAF485_26440, partial [Chloroflexota bacterium]